MSLGLGPGKTVSATTPGESVRDQCSQGKSARCLHAAAQSRRPRVSHFRSLDHSSLDHSMRVYSRRGLGAASVSLGAGRRRGPRSCTCLCTPHTAGGPALARAQPPQLSSRTTVPRMLACSYVVRSLTFLQPTHTETQLPSTLGGVTHPCRPSADGLPSPTGFPPPPYLLPA